MTSMNSSGVLSSRKSTSALKISWGFQVKEFKWMPSCQGRSVTDQTDARAQKIWYDRMMRHGQRYCNTHKTGTSIMQGNRQVSCPGIKPATGLGKDTVLVEDELNQLLWAHGERDCRVVREATTFLGLQGKNIHKTRLRPGMVVLTYTATLSK